MYVQQQFAWHWAWNVKIVQAYNGGDLPNIIRRVGEWKWWLFGDEHGGGGALILSKNNDARGAHYKVVKGGKMYLDGPKVVFYNVREGTFEIILPKESKFLTFVKGLILFV
jgi:hypothetical protein